MSWAHLSLYIVSLLILTIMTREEALATARNYGLEPEVAYEMDHHDCTPEEALAEWDIL